MSKQSKTQPSSQPSSQSSAEAKRPKLASVPAPQQVEQRPAPAAAATTASPAPTRAPAGPTHEQIARRAYEIWEARGYDHGQHDHDWQQAEHELKVGKK